MREMISGPTLAELMEHRTLSMDEVLTWAPSIAAAVEAVHREGRSHGEVSASAVRIEGHRAVLMPGSAGFETKQQPQDIAQFAAVLKTMLRRTKPETDAELAQWKALDRIASTNINASEGCRMRKVTAALKLVRPGFRTALAASPAPPAKDPADPRPKPRRVLMVVKEVPRGTPTKLPKAYVKTLHVWTYFVWAAGLAVAACVVYLKLVR